MGAESDVDLGSGSGSSLHPALLLSAGLSALVATLISAMSIYLHLKNYRKPMLQRMVVRIMLMVPIYAISSLISLFSLGAAFIIDAIRDIYEAFVIYCFFQLLLGYLGGERSLLILVHGRPPKEPPFPVSIFKHEIDISDPYTFLFLKRGIFQYVQVKPILAIATLLLKSLGKFNGGNLRANSGYLYVSIVYNISICLALYCLAMFWLCVNNDLKPFRPMPKFLCVKGVLFFSFWQAIGISVLVAAGLIQKLGPYTDSEHISLGLTDTLIIFEMPVFAIAHMYAFAHTDYVDQRASYVGRMPLSYAFRDAFGLRDVVEDSKETLGGKGMDYREFEPSEGHIHQGIGRDRRIHAGLRYADGGRRKYWLPRHAGDRIQPAGRFESGFRRVVDRVARRGEEERGAETEVYAPLLEGEAASVVHNAPDLQPPLGPDEDSMAPFISVGQARRSEADDEADGFDLPFGDLDEEDEELFGMSKRYLFGDYNYPCIDVSSEAARLKMWDAEERILRDERGAYWSPLRNPGGLPKGGYGALDSTYPRGGGGAGSKEDGTGYKGKTRGGEEQERRRVVDYDDSRVHELDAGDVKLRWTRGKPRATKGQQHSPSRVRSSPRSPAMRQIGETPSSPSSSSSPNGRTRRNGRSRSRSPPPTPREDSRRAVLPPDAVDLVVEDSEAAEEHMTRERRKGEPATKGLRKVYRRGYVLNDAEGRETEEGEVEVDRGRAEDDVFKVADDEEVMIEDVRAESPVARAETPPVHARIDLPSDDNPWA